MAKRLSIVNRYSPRSPMAYLRLGLLQKGILNNSSVDYTKTFAPVAKWTTLMIRGFAHPEQGGDF